MLISDERELLDRISGRQLLKDTAALAAFDRRSGLEGERKALDFLTGRLSRAGVQWRLHRYTSWISDPREARLFCIGENGRETIPCKTWSFCAPSRGVLSGPAVFSTLSGLASNPLTYLADRGRQPRDLEGKIVVSPTASAPAVMDAGDRGARAMVCVWPQGNEELIHEGNVNMVWGQPDPLESTLYPQIPVVHLNRPDGEKLIDRVRNGGLSLELETFMDEGPREIPVLEAWIPPTEPGARDFILLGSHLDSWFCGASDNATGNAIALNMAELFAREPRRNRGLRICWWSGHSNGRYAGSSAYARENWNILESHCLAVCNADMPGMKGALDFGRGSSGPDLRGLYGAAIADITGQDLRESGFITGWDLSFKNLGISSCMSWTSTLPDGSPESTGGGFMSWWWHTEADLMDYVDPEILCADGRLYGLVLYRLLCRGLWTPDPQPIAGALDRRLRALADTEDLRTLLKEAAARPAKTAADALRRTRLLNRALYSFKAPWQQDWAIGMDLVPGLSLAQSSKPASERGKMIVEDFRRSQKNRLVHLLKEL